MQKKYNPKIHKRRSVRLQDYDYSQAGAYFVTVCSHEKKCLFGKITNDILCLNEIGETVHSELEALSLIQKNLNVDELVVMPNHLHVLISLSEVNSVALGQIVRSFKARCTKKVKLLHPSIETLWQRNYHEHIIRNEKSYIEIREYIQTNPLRWDKDIYHQL